MRIIAIFAMAFPAVLAMGQGGILQSTGPTSAPTNNVMSAGMGLEQKLGGFIPKDLTFKDESGQVVRIGDLLGKRPTLIVPIFYNCRTGCAMIEDSILKTLVKARHYGKMIVGRDLDVIFFSLRPTETPDLARSKKILVMNTYGHPESAKDWHFLTSDLKTAKALAAGIGVSYVYDARNDIVNHPMCTVTATVNGRIAGYTIGTGFPTREEEALLDLAQQNRFSEVPAEQRMMFGCIRMDPVTGKRTIVIEAVVRLAMGLMLLFMVCWIIYLARRYKTVEQPEFPIGNPKVTP